MKKIYLTLILGILLLGTILADEVNVLTTDSSWTSDSPIFGCDGLNSTANQDFYLYSIVKSGTNNASKAYIMLANGTSLGNATFSANTATFTNDILIRSGTPFSMFTGADGVAVVSVYKSTTNPQGSTTYFSTRAKTAMDCTTLAMSLDQTGFTSNILTVTVKDNPTYSYLGKVTLYNDNSLKGLTNSNLTANLNLVGLSTNMNWTNHTYNIWFSNGTLFNSTLTTGLSNSNNTNISKLFNLAYGDYKWNVYACYKNTTKGECSWSSYNYSFSTIKVINSVSYISNVSEGSSQQFSLNFSLGDNYQVSTVSLIYNGTSYTGTFINSSGFIIGYKTITIPDYPTDSNISFYFNITLNDGSYFNSSIYYQYVTTLAIDDCSLYSYVLYNFTIKDEKTQINLTSVTNTTIEANINIWDITRSTSILNYTKKYLDINPAKVCLSLNISSSNYSVDAVIKYFSEDNSTSSIEYYNILNSTVGSNINYVNISLYAINVSEVTDFQLTYRDSQLALAPDILFYIMREYVSEGQFKTVEIPRTDSNGQAVLHLVRNDVRYTFVAVNSKGEIVATFNNVYAFCQDYTIGSCTVNLNARSTEDKVYKYLEDVGITYSLSYSNTTELISLTFLSNDLTTKEVSINAIRNSDFGNRTVCTGSLTSLSGIVTCNASDVRSTDNYLFVEIYVDGELKTMETINLEGESFTFGVSGYFFAFMIILLIFTLFIEDKQILLIALGFGFIVVIGFGLLKGKIFGLASGGVWLIICILILLFKLGKEEKGQ